MVRGGICLGFGEVAATSRRPSDPGQRFDQPASLRRILTGVNPRHLTIRS